MKNEPVSDVKLVSHFIYRQIGHYPFDVCRWWRHICNNICNVGSTFVIPYVW
jgi:hypothetical protein